MANKKPSRGKGADGDGGRGAAETKESASLSPSGIRRFFQEVMAEFNKIVWPAKKVTAGLTGFVLVLVVVISIYLGSVDLLLGKLVTFILN